MLLGREIRIIHVRDHYEGYINGEFIASGDTWKEVIDELEKQLEVI